MVSSVINSEEYGELEGEKAKRDWKDITLWRLFGEKIKLKS